jgi:hypothetical protein
LYGVDPYAEGIKCLNRKNKLQEEVDVLTTRMRSDYDIGNIMHLDRNIRKCKERIKQELKGAVDFFMNAEGQGHPFAKVQLGLMCRNNNPDRAREYFDEARSDLERLAGNNNEDAIEYLRYINGVPRS